MKAEKFRRWNARTSKDPRHRNAAFRAVTTMMKRAQQRGLPVDGGDAFREELIARIRRGRCEVTGLPLSYGGAGRHMKPFTPSFDRIVPERGYVPGNVRVVCWALNAAMGSWGMATTETVARALLTSQDLRRSSAEEFLQ